VEQIRESRERIDAELSKVIIGQRDVTSQLLISLFAGGHCLITGAPGLAKTLLVRSVADLFHLKFQRIQFTPDLMPADITGTEILEESSDGHRKLQFIKGPIFANVILADEINRTPPKTQAALLEAMQEHQVTIGDHTYPLPDPFLVMATQNPLEHHGTYPLPESQLDRFLMRIELGYPDNEAERALLQGEDRRDLLEHMQPCMDAKNLLGLQQRAHGVHASPALLDYVQALLQFSRDAGLWVHGLSPRAGLGLVRAARAWALVDQRNQVIPDDVQAVLPAIAGHRLQGREGQAPAQAVRTLIESVPIP